MSTRTHVLSDLHNDEAITAIFAISPQIFGPDKITGTGPQLLDAIGNDLSLDDTILDIEDGYG